MRYLILFLFFSTAAQAQLSHSYELSSVSLKKYETTYVPLSDDDSTIEPASNLGASVRYALNWEFKPNLFLIASVEAGVARLRENLVFSRTYTGTNENSYRSDHSPHFSFYNFGLGVSKRYDLNEKFHLLPTLRINLNRTPQLRIGVESGSLRNDGTIVKYYESEFEVNEQLEWFVLPEAQVRLGYTNKNGNIWTIGPYIRVNESIILEGTQQIISEGSNLRSASFTNTLTNFGISVGYIRVKKKR